MCLVLTRERVRMTPRVTLTLKRAPHLWPRKSPRHGDRSSERESTQASDMVTGVTEQIRSQRDILTGSHEEVMYCSPSTCSGKQKKNRSRSQPQFRSENTPATIEVDQILLALQNS